jgi:membrane protein required for colicin V production
MSTYDLVVLILIGLAAFKGFRKGMIRELAGLLGLIVAIYLAWLWMGDVGNILQKILHNGLSAVPLVSFALLFAVLLTAFNLFARFATRLLDMTLVLGLVNRVAGAVLAGLQVFLIVLLVNWLADRTGLISDNLKKESHLYPVIAGAGPALYNFSEIFFPQSEKWMDTLSEQIENFKKTRLESEEAENP